jgi:hypothetical protein
MARKATAKHTPELPPLDDDRHWVLMKIAHQRWAERTQDNQLAVIKLTKALAHDLPSMKQSPTGERTLVEPAMWTPGRFMLWFGKDGLRVVEHVLEHVQPGENVVLTVRGWFYVSLPHLDLLLPPPHAISAPAVDDDDTSDEPPRVRPGPKATGDWPELIDQWLIEVALNDPQKLLPPQNIDEIVDEAKLFLHNQIKWAPKDDKDLRAHIVVRLKRVRR